MHWNRLISFYFAGLLAASLMVGNVRADEPRKSIDVILDDLAQGTAHSTYHAIKALQQRPENAGQALPRLFDLLGDEREGPQRFLHPPVIGEEAMLALLGYGDMIVPGVIEVLEKDHDEESNERSRALSLLNELGRPAAAPAAPAVAAIFYREERDSYKSTLLKCYDTIEKDPSNVEALVLHALKTAPSYEKKADDEYVDLIYGSEAQLLGEAIRIAGERRLKHPQIIKRLSEAIDDERAFLIVSGNHFGWPQFILPHTMEALGRIGPPARQAEKKLREHLEVDEFSRANHLFAAFAICGVTGGDEKALSILMEQAKSDDLKSSTPGIAIRLLGELGPIASEAWPVIAQHVRAEEGDAMGQLTDAERQRLESRRLAAIKSASQIGGEGADALLREALASDSPQDQKVATEAIAALGPAGKRWVPHLIEALNQEKNNIDSLDVLIAIADALGEIGPEAKDAVSRLKQLESDLLETELTRYSILVKAAVRRALLKIER